MPTGMSIVRIEHAPDRGLQIGGSGGTWRVGSGALGLRLDWGQNQGSLPSSLRPSQACMRLTEVWDSGCWGPLLGAQAVAGDSTRTRSRGLGVGWIQ